MMTATASETQKSKPSVSASVPDWTRERAKGRAWDHSRALLRSSRDYQRAEGSLSGLRRK